MRNIAINQYINTASTIVKFILVIFIAILITKSIWWMINPLGYTAYDGNAKSAIDSDKLAQAIINTAPFGIITEEKAPLPTIAEQLKVVGVYAGGPNNSIAFITVNGKNSILTIGESVLNATLKAVIPTGAIFIADKQDVTISINPKDKKSGDDSGNRSPVPNLPQGGSPGYISNPGNNSYNDMNRDDRSPNNPENADLMEKRKKMIEEFQRQNSASENNNNTGGQPR